MNQALLMKATALIQVAKALPRADIVELIAFIQNAPPGARALEVRAAHHAVMRLQLLLFFHDELQKVPDLKSEEQKELALNVIEDLLGKVGR